MRQLVERGPAGRTVTAAGIAVPPHVAERRVVEPRRCQPHAAEMFEQRTQQLGRLDRGSSRLAGQQIKQRTRSRRAAEYPEYRLLGFQRLAEATQQCSATFQAEQRIVGTDLEQFGQMRRIDALQTPRIHLQRFAALGRKRTIHERVKAGYAESFGPCVDRSAGFLPAPVGAGPGVEQYADHGQVQTGACQCFVLPGTDQAAQCLHPIDTAGFEMSPAAVIGDVQPGILAERQLGDEPCSVCAPAVVNAEPGRVAGFHRGGDVGAALADRGRFAQGAHRLGRLRVHRPRPLMALRVSRSSRSPSV